MIMTVFRLKSDMRTLQTRYNSVVGIVVELHIQTLQEPVFLHRIRTRNGYFPLLCHLGICMIFLLWLHTGYVVFSHPVQTWSKSRFRSDCGVRTTILCNKRLVLGSGPGWITKTLTRRDPTHPLCEQGVDVDMLSRWQWSISLISMLTHWLRSIS
jgi:hypothetical protein